MSEITLEQVEEIERKTPLDGECAYGVMKDGTAIELLPNNKSRPGDRFQVIYLRETETSVTAYRSNSIFKYSQ